MEPVNAMPLLIVCGFALFDVLVGLVKAFATDGFKSEKMRRGLWHKTALVAVMVLAMALELATQTMDFSAVGLDIGASLPVSPFVAAYIVLMETGSILESACEINPDLKGTALFKKFDVVIKGAKDADDR
mgnify:CR=1 FL=1